MEMDISFTAVGVIHQTIKITNPDYKNLTKEDIIEKLNSGDIITTAQEDGEVMIFIDNDFKTIGKVISSDTDLEYEDFEWQDDDDDCENEYNLDWTKSINKLNDHYFED